MNICHLLYNVNKKLIFEWSMTISMNFRRVTDWNSRVIFSRQTLYAIPDEDKARIPDGMILINIIFLLLFWEVIKKQSFSSKCLFWYLIIRFLSRKRYSDGTLTEQLHYVDIVKLTSLVYSYDLFRYPLDIFYLAD